MYLKTEQDYVNEDDFCENYGSMKELTVTITLCEYRNLIEYRAYSEKNIEYLQEKNESLRKENERLLQIFLIDHPNTAKSLEEAIEAILKDIRGEGE